MSIYAVFFNGNKMERIKNVSERHEELLNSTCSHDGEQAADVIQQETGASAVVAATDANQAVAEAADVCGLDEVEY